MPNPLNLLDIYSQDDNPDYVAEARRNLLVDLLNKYSARSPESNYKNPNPLYA